MKKAVVVIVWAMLSAVSASAAQVCPNGIPQTTPTADFTNHGDGTLTHKVTGRMWKQCVEGLSGVGCASGTVSKFTWQEALQRANVHSFAGYDDWRLPNIKELSSIIERSCYDPAINLSVFPNGPSSSVWSGSPYADDTNDAWGVLFNGGYDVLRLRTDSYSVRLVRGGQ
ncbi:DUF1566 domain-containing protein [Pseudomonadota bacterium]